MQTKSIIALFLAVVFFPGTLCAELRGLDKFFAESPAGVDYIMSLYDDADIIILGERDHRDTTQYNLINRLICDPRFVQKVGYVYTEVGTVNTAAHCAKTVMADYASLAEFRDSALAHLRNEDFYPLWDKYNRYQLLKDIYKLNSLLPKEKRVSLMGTDLAFDWNTMHGTAEYRKFLDEEVNSGKRDITMAQNFVSLFDKQPRRNSNHKALLITNAPHAMLDSLNQRVGYLLKKRYGNRLKVVLLNWTKWWTGGQDSVAPWLDGVLDSAYVKTERLDFGFNLEGSPIENAKYFNNDMPVSDYANGMVYYLAPKDFVLTMGIPGIVDASFTEELYRREVIYNRSVGRENRYTPETLAEYYNNKRSFNPYADYETETPAGLNMEFEDAVKIIIQAFETKDLNLLLKVGIESPDERLFGSKLLLMENLEHYDDEGLSIGTSVELRLKDGNIIRRNLFLRKNDVGNYVFDGGL